MNPATRTPGTKLMSLSCKPLQPFGAEVDINLASDLDEAQQAELRQLVAQHGVLVFRNQHFDYQRQIAFMKTLGPVPQDGRNIEMVSNTVANGAFGGLALAFHSDLTFSPKPDIGASLHATDVVDGASATKFASTANAYERLPADLQKRLEALEVLHVYQWDLTRRNRKSEMRPDSPMTAHPAIWTHPLSGRKALYISYAQADSIVGMPPDESERLLQELFAVLLDASNIYEHQWNNGDLVLWDNHLVLHGRDEVAHVGQRTLERVALAETTFFEMYPNFDWTRDFSTAEGAQVIKSA